MTFLLGTDALLWVYFVTTTCTQRDKFNSQIHNTCDVLNSPGRINVFVFVCILLYVYVYIYQHIAFQVLPFARRVTVFDGTRIRAALRGF